MLSLVGVWAQAYLFQEVEEQQCWMPKQVMAGVVHWGASFECLLCWSAIS